MSTKKVKAFFRGTLEGVYKIKHKEFINCRNRTDLWVVRYRDTNATYTLQNKMHLKVKDTGNQMVFKLRGREAFEVDYAEFEALRAWFKAYEPCEAETDLVLKGE